MDRRDFLKTAALAAGAAAIPGAVPAQVRTGADLIFLGGPVVTMEQQQPVAEALAVRAGRIQQMGTRAATEALRDASTRVVDLAGRTLTPGLIDAHSHLVPFGQMEGVRLDPNERMTFQQALEAHTIEAAYAAFDEKELGSLRPGKVADFAVWNHDLRQTEAGRLEDLKVVATYVAGKEVWRA